MSDTAQQDIPEKLGRYDVESMLGQGAMGIVYKAKDSVIEREVALKVIRKDLLDQRDASDVLARFRQEAKAAGRLQHPNIVNVYDYGEDGDLAYIAMEYIRGKELKSFFDANERFDIEDIVKIMTQLLDALEFSHNAGVIHRDLKPANIFVLDNGSVKIADFGIAKLDSSHLTQAGTVMGTPSYMSPEQFMGQPVDRRSDLFSMGVILYQFLTSEKPFTGSMTTIMHKVLNTVPLKPSILNMQMPEQFDEVVLKALDKRPKYRFQTAKEFIEALEKAHKGEMIAPKTKADATIVGSADLESTMMSPRQNSNAQETMYARSPVKANQTAANVSPVQDNVPTKKSLPILWIAIGLFAVIIAMAGVMIMQNLKPSGEVDANNPQSSANNTIGDNATSQVVAGSGFLKVSSEPEGAVLLSGSGDFLGITPERIELKAGHHQIIFRKDGYQDFTAEIDMEANVDIPFHANLIKQ